MVYACVYVYVYVCICACVNKRAQGDVKSSTEKNEEEKNNKSINKDDPL